MWHFDRGGPASLWAPKVAWYILPMWGAYPLVINWGRAKACHDYTGNGPGEDSTTPTDPSELLAKASEKHIVGHNPTCPPTSHTAELFVSQA
jgi:hypothetical protein